MPWLICGNVCNSLANNDDFMKLTAIILKPTRLNFQNVCNSLANNVDFMKLTAIILKQTRLNFQNVYYSLGNNKSFYKNDENTLRFKGNSWESLDENHEKEGTTTKDTSQRLMFSLGDSL